MAENSKKNTELSKKHELFCQNMSSLKNLADAYMATYKSCKNRSSASTLADRLLKKVEIKARVDQLDLERIQRTKKNGDDVIKKLWQILNFDPKPFLEINQEKIKVANFDGKTTEELKTFLKIVDWEQIPGELISEIKIDKNGNPAIKFVSKETALRLIKEIYFDKNIEPEKESKIVFGGESSNLKSIIDSQNKGQEND